MQTKHQKRYLRKVLTNLARDDPKTKEVVLNGFAIGNEHDKMAQLAMSLVSNKHIKILCLNDCEITSKGAHLLAYALCQNTSLDHIWMNENKIGSSGADAIAAALAKNQTLLSVGLSYNSIGNHGGKAIAKALRKNCSITDVFVEGNRMSNRVEDRINSICYGTENDCDDGDEILEYPFSSNQSTTATDDCDAGTVAGSVVSTMFVTKALDSIKEVDYESDSDSQDGSSTSSTMSDDDPMDFDFTCFYQRKKKSKFSKLKAMVRRKKVEPGLQ
ncbi:hypothetical protein ACHAXR_008284 [Thalassiosira sp. AJA248-18]